MTEPRSLPLWRSMLFVPANVERFVGKAHMRGADAIILDLEDSIMPAEKAEARACVADAAARVGRDGADVLVRINRPWRLAVADLEAVISPAISAVILPKVPDAGHIRAIAEIVDELEAERGMPIGHTRFDALLETPDAIFRAREIAGAHPRLIGMNTGSEDLATEMRMPPEPDGLFWPSMQVAIAARAAGILPLGFIGTLADFSDLDGFRTLIRRARKLGFEGASCIHPAQVPILNEEFAPTPDEVDTARRVIAAADEAAAAGRGSATVDGKMIDIPIVDRARLTLARWSRIEGKG